MQTRKTHHDTGCTEAALRAMVARQGLLYRMRFGISKVFDGENLRTVDRSDRNNTGIYRVVLQYTVSQTAEQYCTGAAVTFSAAFLRACQAFFKPQKIEQRLVRIERRSPDDLAAQEAAELSSCVGQFF